MKLRIEKPIYGGAGLARADGKAVFVPFTLPGETVEAHALDDARSYTTAELDAVLDPSPARATPPCPYFGECGGCHYQHAIYAAQVELKLTILRETLERARIADIPDIAALTAEPLGYRNRVRLHVQREPFALCYKRRNSHVNLPIDHCPIAMPGLQQAIAALTREGVSLGLSNWVTELELFSSADEAALLLTLWTPRPPNEARQKLSVAWPALRQLLPTLAGTSVFASDAPGKPRNGRSTRVRRNPTPIAHAGDDSLTYVSGAQQYQVSAGSFFQVNRFLIPELVTLITDNAAGQAAWDLYAGAGLFSVPLSENFSELVAVESSPGAIRDLRHNLRGPGRRIVASDTASFLQQALRQRLPAPDLVVVDPPRAGLGRDVTSHLGKLRPRNITYVSCDPATLSRDLSALLESGYRLRNMRLVDLFPQTFHMESVTHLSLD